MIDEVLCSLEKQLISFFQQNIVKNYSGLKRPWLKKDILMIVQKAVHIHHLWVYQIFTVLPIRVFKYSGFEWSCLQLFQFIFFLLTKTWTRCLPAEREQWTWQPSLLSWKIPRGFDLGVRQDIRSHSTIFEMPFLTWINYDVQ